MARRRRLSGERRRELIEKLLAVSDKCHWCPKRLDLETATLDHIITVAEGGTNTDDNQVLACRPCNQERGPTSYEVFHKKRFPPSNVLRISHSALEQCGTSIDEWDFEMAKLELGTRVAGAILKENAKPRRDRIKSAIHARFKVIEKILDRDSEVTFYLEPEKAEHCIYTHDIKKNTSHYYRKRFIRTWGDKPFGRLDE